MSMGVERLKGGRAAGWRTILGLLLVPLTAAGVLLWGLWNPTERLTEVTAAVVNLDEPVTVDGQLLPMGRMLAGELIGDPRDASGDSGDADGAGSGETRTGFTWVLTDEADASAGLDDGRYATVVTIPENFSSAATSASQGAEAVRTATIDIRTSERGRLLDQALSNIVTTTATSLLNEQLGAQFVGTVFVGMTELGTGLGEAADGAEQLAAGGEQLASGAQQLASGAQELAGGAQELANGTAQLSSGAQQLAGGAGQLADGAHAAAAGGAQLAAGVESYTGTVNQVLTGVQGSAPELVAQLRSMYAAIEAGAIPMPPEEQQVALARLAGAIAELETLATQLQPLIDAGTDLAAGARASAAGQAQLANGTSELSAGINGLASGAPELAAGAQQLAAGTSLAADGTQLTADGARLAADGTSELASGLREAGDAVPAYTDAERERLAEAMVSPVEAQGASDELFNASGVPLFAGIALWAGALASFLVLAPLWSRTREAARGVGFVTLRSALPAVGLGAAQGVLAGAILPLLLGYDLLQGLGFFALALVAGISFSLVNQGLSALLGGFGRFLSFALLAVAFAIGVISTAPPLLQSIGDASPVGALFAGFQAVAVGAAGSGAALGALILWGLAGFALTAFAVARERRRPV